MKLENGCHGIDISHHNKNIDFCKIDQSFIFIKATEGKTFVSPKWKTNCDGAEHAGTPYGVYHYYKPGISPLKQAELFCKHIRGDLPPVLDIEELNGQTKKKLDRKLKYFLMQLNCIQELSR